MMEKYESKGLQPRQATIQPADIATGLGAADRQLLATCIVLFEDTSLRHRVGTLFDEFKGWAGCKADEWQGVAALAGDEARSIAESVQSRSRQWLESAFTDAQLRLALWMYLREAFELPARACVSTRSAARSCDDLTARLLQSLGPGWFQKLKAKTWRGDVPVAPVTLDVVARQTLEELMREMLESTGPAMVGRRERLIAEARDRIQHLSADDRTALLRAIGSDELNDAAISKILLAGGGITMFGASVGWAGFSAYILAAQASAFIPLISGPALVSLVSVLSNPLSVIAFVAGGAWWMAKDAQRRVNRAVAMRVIALLAMNGLCAGPNALQAMVRMFRSADDLRPFNDLTGEVIHKYQQDWQTLKHAWRRGMPDTPAVAEAMERPLTGSAESRLGKIISIDDKELRDTVALSVLTVGDVLWHMFAVDPAVMEAADFSHIGDLGNAADFAAFADKVEAMDVVSRTGEVADLKGYVAERLVASQLTDAGYQVKFPTASNEPGWDISVDGVKVQIKDTDSFDYLQHHFDHWGAQYPVIVNSEMAGKVLDHHPAWADHIYVVDGYSNELVEHLTRQLLDAGAGVDHSHVPLFTLALSAYRNYERFRGGRITGEQAVQQVLMDGGTKVALAHVGGLVGPAVGLFVFGPAGALVFGAVAPILSQMQSRNVQGFVDKYVTSPSYLDWQGEARRSVEGLIDNLRDTLRRKASTLQTRIDGLCADQVAEYLRWRAEDELACLREAWCRLEAVLRDSESSVEVASVNLLAWLSEAPIHSVTYQTELKRMVEVFKRRPTTGAKVTEQAQAATRSVWRKLSELRQQWKEALAEPRRAREDANKSSR